jgi:hypothetical protein
VEYALLSAVLTRKVYVRLLVSKWAHTSGLIAPFLVALQNAADAGRARGKARASARVTTPVPAASSSNCPEVTFPSRSARSRANGSNCSGTRKRSYNSGIAPENEQPISDICAALPWLVDLSRLRLGRFAESHNAASVRSALAQQPPF